MNKAKESYRGSTRWQVRVVWIFLMAAPLAAQTGWKTVKDKTGVCQMSYPSNWTPLSQPGLINSPQGRTSMVISGQRPYRAFSPDTLKVLGVDKVLENTSSRALWAGKPVGAFVTYHVESPGKTNSCIAEITVPANAPEDDVKKIAVTLSKAP